MMYLCDEVAGIAAIRHSGPRVVTAGVDRMTFLHPVMVGDLVTVRATVNAAWRTSMEVGVRVEREQVRDGAVEHTSTACLTMVAVDEDRRPVEVPAIAPETEDEERRQREAELRRRNRLV
jgi:acyl-CoA hydrolase